MKSDNENNLESPFGLEELFFSRTNKKGIILSGNSVFKRVSQFDWSDLLNRPHNIVRHSHMPRGVFYLFWKTILSGSSIGAYVKNKSKSGSYYWVFALAIPIEDGFLSIRLKPSSALFEVVKTEYEKLRQIEKSHSLEPVESSDLLEKTIVGLGYKNYESFMIDALMQELFSRQEKLGLPPVGLLLNFKEILKRSDYLLDKAKKITKEFDQSALLPLNLTVQAARLDRAGDSLAVIASKYAQLSGEIKDEFIKFVSTTERLQVSISKCQYSICANLLQNEVMTFFKNESDPGPIDVKNEAMMLESLAAKMNRDTVADLMSIMLEFDQLRLVCEQLKTVVTGLEIVRLMGKIEIARLDQNFEQLNHLILQLLDFKNYLVKSLAEIARYSSDVKTIASETLTGLQMRDG